MVKKIRKPEVGSRKWKDRKPLVVSRQLLTTYGLRLTAIILFTAFYLPLTTYGLYGYSSLDSYWKWGEPQRGLSARSLSMGSAGIASGENTLALYSNPAIMHIGNDKGALSISPGIVWFFDKRNHSYLNTDYVTTNNLYFQPASASMLWSASKRGDVVLGFGYFSDLNFDYNFEEENFTNDTIDKIECDGDFHNWALGLNWQLADWISTGFTYLWGRGRRDKEFTYITTSMTGNLIEKTSGHQTLTGDSFIAGTNIICDNRINFGISYRSDFDMTVKEKAYGINASTSVHYIYSFPYQLGFGLNYDFQDENESRITFDIIFSKWGSSKYWLTRTNGVKQTKVKSDPLFRDVLEFHTGFEHSPIDKAFLRYGFSYIPDYPAAAGAVPAVSAGCGLLLGRANVDIGGEYAWRENTQSRISQASTGFDNVAESRIKILATVGYQW